jgi:GNAT superfamily N-acetyltransferase
MIRRTALQLTIRAFEAADLPLMQQVREAAFTPVFQSFRNLVGEQIASIVFARADLEQAGLLETLCNPGSGQHVFVATMEDRVIAFVSFSLDSTNQVGEIGLNAVHPDYAGRGIGTKLYDFAIAQMKANGMLVATVGTGGDASHAPARRAYEKAGFGPAVPSLFLYKLL